MRLRLRASTNVNSMNTSNVPCTRLSSTFRSHPGVCFHADANICVSGRRQRFVRSWMRSGVGVRCVSRHYKRKSIRSNERSWTPVLRTGGLRRPSNTVLCSLLGGIQILCSHPPRDLLFWNRPTWISCLRMKWSPLCGTLQKANSTAMNVAVGSARMATNSRWNSQHLCTRPFCLSRTMTFLFPSLAQITTVHSSSPTRARTLQKFPCRSLLTTAPPLHLLNHLHCLPSHLSSLRQGPPACIPLRRTQRPCNRRHPSLLQGAPPTTTVCLSTVTC